MQCAHHNTENMQVARNHTAAPHLPGPQGDYVVLASEPAAVCGCDVAAPQQVRRSRQQPLEQFFSSFSAQFTAQEWVSIRAAGPDDAAKEAQFRCDSAIAGAAGQEWAWRLAVVQQRPQHADGPAAHFVQLLPRSDQAALLPAGDCGA
jgi:hypothetical protein